MPENPKKGLIYNETSTGEAIITLADHVQGGSDALEFSSILFELNDKGTKCVIMNLENVKIMNSSGLGMLVSGLNTLKKNDIKMILSNVPEKINDLLQMTHLNQVFTVFNTWEEAIESYK